MDIGNAVCGFGHRSFISAEAEKRLSAIINYLCFDEEKEVFYTGGMGAFDKAFSSAVRVAKRERPRVKLILVLPYYSNKLNTHKDHYSQLYDEIVLPDILSDSYYRAAINLRNMWMIDSSSAVISGVCRDHGGAYNSVRFAKKIKKRIIRLYDCEFE
ncbi:MAG: DUF1273 domain-containing protein [Clostridia bacterium]|nr:DUF1273 domain-containing protein [Clostridia bacterium]